MAAPDETDVHANSAKIPRFSTQDGVRAEFIDVPQNGCRLAVSGYRRNANDTFIDLFTLKPDSDSKEKSLCRTFQPYFSKEFTRIEGTAWRLRCICLVDGAMFVTCFGDTIELYNSGNGQLVAKCTFSGEASCMTIRDKRIYLCLYKPTFEEVIVFDLMLTNQIQRIKLAELTGWPCDVAVSSNKLFICTEDGRALMYNSCGDREQEYKKPNQRYSKACSITVSEENELIYILWKSNKRSLVIVYSLLGVHSSFSRGHFLASFDIPDYSSRIRINNIVNRLFVVATKTGELYEYHTENIINFQNLLRLWEVLISQDGNQKLLKYFKVPTDKAKTIKDSKEPSKSLFFHLRETGEISDRDFLPLLKACDQQGILKVTDAWTDFLQFLAYQQLKRTLEKTQLEKKEQTEKIVAGNEQREQLTDKLREVTSKLEKSDEKLQQCQNSLRLVVGEKNQQLVTKLNATEEEPRQFKDSLEATKEEKQQLVRKITDLESEKQQLLNERKSLEAVTEEREQLKRKIKLIEEENSTLRSQFLRQNLMEERRERVTLGIPTTEKRLVSIDFVEEEHTSSTEKSTPEVLAALSDEKSGDLYAKTTSLSPSSHEKLRRESTSKREPYIEHKINHEGGTITVAGVNLSIPDGALSNDRVISVTVIRDPVISIPGSAPRGRMTPLIKLEPNRLQLNKPATLTIPHSAIIPEPDRHGVTVFTGLLPEEESQKDQITWTEEKSLKGKLKQETISLDISQLAYIVVNLESREKGQKHIFRVVPFIDGILHATDDVLITVCFCRDNKAAYQLLVEEHKSKLTLGNYTTFQVSRVLNEVKDSISHLDLVMVSQGGNYHPSEDDAKKFVDIDHLCAASTVTQQFRLKRSQDGNIFDGIVDVKLTVSQGEENRIPLTLKSKVKDVLLSPQDQGIPYRDLPKATLMWMRH